MAGTALGARDAAVNKRGKVLALIELTFHVVNRRHNFKKFKWTYIK